MEQRGYDTKVMTKSPQPPVVVEPLHRSMLLHSGLLLFCLLCLNPSPELVGQEKTGKAAVSTMSVEEIQGYESYPEDLKKLVGEALELTRMNLRYEFGSAEPKRGGMDCSGTIYHLLQKHGFKDVPRQSDEICRWVMRNGVFYRTENVGKLDETAFRALRPGDLLFWSGTYETRQQRALPISHVMIYLGKRKKDGKAVVFGASDGRTYDGQRRNGVSVFDFQLPSRGSKVEFYGYGGIPFQRLLVSGKTSLKK